MLKKKEQISEERYGELGQALNFTYGDLQANRAGFLTKRQAGQVSRKQILSSLGFLSISGSFACLGLTPIGLLFYETVYQPARPLLGVIFMWVLVIFLGIFFVGIACLAAYSAFLTVKGQHAEGKNRRVDKSLVTKSRSSMALVSHLDGRFPVSEEVYKRIEDEQFYCLYYSDSDKAVGLRLYSIEPFYGEYSAFVAGFGAADFEQVESEEDAKEKRTI